MTRTTIGGIAAGAFALGLLAGLLLPGTFAATRHDELMTDHISAKGAMSMTGSMPMGMDTMPMDVGRMHGTGAMPMMPAASGMSGHGRHVHGHYLAGMKAVITVE